MMKFANDKKYTIGIIGAGPSGSLTAYLLSQQGHDVHLFEKAAEYPISRKVCGEYLCPAGKDILMDLGVHNLLLSYEKIFGMKIYSSSSIEVDTLFPELQFGYSLKRDQFDHDLVILAKASGAVVHWKTTMRNFELRADERIECVDQHDSLWVFDYLIGADGRQSQVAKWIGVKKRNIEEEKNSKKVAIHCYLNAKNDRKVQAQGEMHLFADGSYCGLNPIEKATWNFSIVCEAEEVKRYPNLYALIQAKIAKSPQLSELFTLPSEDELVIKVVAHIKNEVTGIASYKHRTFLVGDASGFVDPLTGEGIYHALLTSTVLGKVFKNAAEEKELFLSYEKIIHKVYQRKVLINIFFQWLIKHPRLCHYIAVFLKPRKKMRDTFVGLIGNVYSPLKALKLMLTHLFF